MTATTRTFQMRLHGEHPALEQMAMTYQNVMRMLYAESRRTGKAFGDFKTDYCKRYGLASRQFNAIQIDLTGKVKSVREKAAHDLGNVEDALERLEKTLKKVQEAFAEADEDRSKAMEIADEHKRVSAVSAADKRIKKEARYKVRLIRKRQRLQARAARLKRTIEASHPKICFGSKKAFKAQHYLDANRLVDHETWLTHWRERRSSEFQVIGSNEEPSGNSTCRACVGDDGSVTLTLTTLDNEKCTIGPLQLPFGHDVWTEAILASDAECKVARAYQSDTAEMKKLYREKGWPNDVLARALEKGIEPEKAFQQIRKYLRSKMSKQGYAISYRFKRDEYGWRVFVTVQQPVQEAKPDYTNGAIGIDMNAEHLALASIDRTGKPVGFQRIDTHVLYKSRGQRQAMYRDAAASIVRKAIDEKRPIVVEDLDFRAKRKRLAEIGCKKQTRMLSSFATTMFKQAIVSAAKRAGVAICFVNPAYTSVIGLTKAVDNGVSVHLAAAMTIARRAIGFGEMLPESIRIPSGHRKPDVLAVPEELQSKPLDVKGMQAIASLIKRVHAARPKPQAGKERRLLRSESAFLASLDFSPG